MIDSARLELPDFEPGHVWLVGAGPGDPGLLSALALHALARADAVVYDALVDSRILRLRAAGGCFALCRQARRPSIAEPARYLGAYHRFGTSRKAGFRLKGGDPCVFGRGAEEALALAAAEIPFRIVPGITAGIGGLAYAGIPVTHRETNSAVTFVTGHNSTGAVPDGLDWEAIARGSPVIVLYMALSHLTRIVEHLIAGGRQTGRAGRDCQQSQHAGAASAGLNLGRTRRSFCFSGNTGNYCHRRSGAVAGRFRLARGACRATARSRSASPAQTILTTALPRPKERSAPMLVVVMNSVTFAHQLHASSGGFPAARSAPMEIYI